MSLCTFRVESSWVSFTGWTALEHPLTMNWWIVCCLVFPLLAVHSKRTSTAPSNEEYEDEYYTSDEEEQLPKTSFSCAGRIDGFYADIEAGCRVYHYCQKVAKVQKDYPFFCPTTTIFRQEYLTCATPDESFNCSESENYYNSNEQLHTTTQSPPSGSTNPSTESTTPSSSSRPTRPPHSTSTVRPTAPERPTWPPRPTFPSTPRPSIESRPTWPPRPAFPSTPRPSRPTKPAPKPKPDFFLPPFDNSNAYDYVPLHFNPEFQQYYSWSHAIPYAWLKDESGQRAKGRSQIMPYF